MSDRMIRAALVVAAALILTAGGCSVGRKAVQEALEAAAKHSDEAAQQAMTAEEAAQLGLGAGRGAGLGYYASGRHQDGQDKSGQASMAPQCSPLNDHADLRKELALCKDGGKDKNCWRYGLRISGCKLSVARNQRLAQERNRE